MDPYSSPSVGFGWSRVPPNQLPTPIPHDIMNSGGAPNIHNAEDTTFLQNAGDADPSCSRPSSRASEADIFMDDAPIPASQNRHTQIASRRNRRGNLNWDDNRKTLHRLYIEEKRLLTDTMDIMKKTYRFNAPAKAYKEKFKSWGWRRNLPGEVAHWMVERANERKAGGRGTAFEFGGKRWTLEEAANSAARSKKVIQDEMETPEGMKIVTPGSNANPNTPTQFEEDVANSNIVFTTEESTANTVSLPLGFNGRSASELGRLLIAARNYAQAGRTLLAEETYTQSLEGFQHVLGQLHATTVKGAFELATFYFQQNRKADADQIFEQLTTTHIRLLGFEDRRTKQHILHIGELLNSLRREEDALAFLSHAHELAQKSDNGASSKNSGKGKGKPKARQEPVQSGKNILLATTIDIRNDPNLSNINHGLDSARLHVAANEPAVVALLKAIESQCLHEPAKFGIQGIHARAELLRYYLKEGVHFANKDFFLGARDILRTYWTAMQYEATSCKIQEAVEAALELTAAVLRGHFDTFAKEMFGLVETDIVKMLGDQDERTIWMWISIGIVYQTHRTWDVAQRWFERAWAAADALWGSADGITRSLSAALFGNKHFSYLNSEGRPFKTIFGVCGFTIRPTRLHLE